MPADPEHPLPSPGVPGPRDSRPPVREDQDEVLARELAAFPAEDEPAWEDLEYLEYLDEASPGDAEPWPAEPWPAEQPGPFPGADPAASATAIPGAADPGITVPGAADAPATTIPGAADAPATTIPGTADPGTTVPGAADPGITVPGTADAPATTVPGTADPGITVPGAADAPATTIPGAADAGITVPGAADPGITVPGAADAGITVPGAADSVTAASASPPGGPGAPGVAAGMAGGGARAGAGFAQGGTADAMPPGPVLAGLADRAWQDGLGGLDDDELTGVLQAWQRLGARAAAGLLAAASELAARREAQARASGDWRPFEHAEDEIAAALTLTRHGATWVLGLALALDRLPLTRAALAAGLIDERKAWLIADELTGLGDEHAAAAEAAIIGNAASQTTGQLRPAVRRAVIAADPAAAKRRKDEALKNARVEATTQSSGTAALSGRDLPPAQVLAADKHLTALAQAMKKAGAEGSMDLLRARAYLHLLAGHPAGTLLNPATPGVPGDGTPGGGTPGHGTPGDGTPGGGTPSGGTRSDSTAGGAPGTGTAGDGAPGDSPAGPGTAGDGTPGDSTGGGAPGTGPAGVGAPGAGPPALRGTVNLTMPLAAWLGWSQSPGQVPGFGTLDAGDCRTIAALLASHPASKWCITLTDPAGHAIAHGCATKGPRPPGRPDPGTGPGPDPGPGPGTGSRPGPGPGSAPGPGPGSRAGPGPGPGPGPRAGPRPAAGPGPPGDPGWIQAVTITPLQTRDCTHPRETSSYQPSRALRHIIEIRQATCSQPRCRRPATACDLDHTIPHHLGGRTCECNTGPVCRHHHKVKQTPGWTLTQNQHQPGTMTWTTPGHRTYTTEPTSYPD